MVISLGMGFFFLVLFWFPLFHLTESHSFSVWDSYSSVLSLISNHFQTFCTSPTSGIDIWSFFSANSFTIHVSQGLANFLCKCQIVNILGFVDQMAYIITTKFCHYSKIAITDSTQINGHGCISTELYVQKKVIDWISLQTFVLACLSLLEYCLVKTGIFCSLTVYIPTLSRHSATCDSRLQIVQERELNMPVTAIL